MTIHKLKKIYCFESAFLSVITDNFAVCVCVPCHLLILLPKIFTKNLHYFVIFTRFGMYNTFSTLSFCQKRFLVNLHTFQGHLRTILFLFYPFSQSYNLAI